MEKSVKNNQLTQVNKKSSHNYVIVLQRTGYNCENYAKNLNLINNNNRNK